MAKRGSQIRENQLHKKWEEEEEAMYTSRLQGNCNGKKQEFGD
jgi:hypothetical protein